MKLDLSCPIELRGYALSCSEGKVEAELRLYNLTARRIASFDGVAKWRSDAADRSIACPFAAERLRAGGENGFRITLSTERLPDADHLEILFTRVRFEDDGPDWRAGDGPFAELEPLPAISRDELERLRAAAGEDAVCYPKQESQTWTCVCGRVNPNGADTCVRCHRDHLAAIAHTPESVRAQAAADEAPDPELAALHQTFLRQRKRLMRRTILAAVAVLALAVLLALHSARGSALVPQSAAAQSIAG